MTAKKSKKSNVVKEMEAISKTNSAGQCQFDGSIQGAIAAAADNAAFTNQVFSATGTLAQLVCIRMPALAPRFLLQSEGWPLGRFFMIDGPEDSCKSAMSYEIGRWHRQATGNMVVIETEQKDAAGLRDSIFSYDRKAWVMHRAYSQEEWNRAYFHWVDTLSTMMDGGTVVDEKGKKVKKPGIGRIAPFCVLVDSMSSVLTEGIIDKMEEAGAPGMNHPIGAKLLADFFRHGPKKIVTYPITFIAINHLKMSTDPRMPNVQVRNTTGGKTPRFQMTTEIEMKRRKAKQNLRTHKEHGEIHSIELHLEIRKNSLASREDVPAEMCWYFDKNQPDPNTGEFRQVTYFDWESSSIELLIDCMKTGKDAGYGFSTKRARELQNLVELHKDDDKRQVWSSALGISEKNRLSYREAGFVLEEKIQNDPEFCKELYNILSIRRRFMFQPGVDIREQFSQNEAALIRMEADTVSQFEKAAIDSFEEVPVE